MSRLGSETWMGWVGVGGLEREGEEASLRRVSCEATYAERERERIRASGPKGSGSQDGERIEWILLRLYVYLLL